MSFSRLPVHRTVLRVTTGLLVAALVSAAVPAGAAVGDGAPSGGPAPAAPGAGPAPESTTGPDERVDVGPGAVRGGGQAKAPRGPQVRAQKAVDRMGRAGLAKAARGSHVSEAEVTKALLADPGLYVDDAGNLTSTEGAGGTGAVVTTGAPDTLIWPIGSTTALHSRPSSPRKIYLDFNGHRTSGTEWNTETRLASFTTPGWGRDGDPTTFTANEAAVVQAAFATVAEDFAAYDVDVTTQDPGVEALRRTSTTDQAYGIRVVVGQNTWYDVTNSGFAKFFSFSWSTDTPAYCFATSTTSTKQIAECISHETGHTVGLFHDGHTAGGAYYAGHGSWAPIMGNSYGRAVTQWSKGEYPGATNGQDDIYVIGQYLGWVADDYVGTTATTATLPAGTTRSGRLTYGTGEYDAFRVDLTVARRVNLQSWEGYQSVDTDLNMRLQLTDSRGTVIATSSPAGNLRTSMTVTLAPGTYYVFVDGVAEGTAGTGWTSYASSGFYNVLLQLV